VDVQLIVAVIVVVAIVAGVGWWAAQRQRSERLRERFGPEYERAVRGAQDRGKAESELMARQERVEALEIRPLEQATRDRFASRWANVQALFVDDPLRAVGQADELIGEVMAARGYPVSNFEQRVADVSVDHPHVVDHYRTAHAIAGRQRSGTADTEQLRQAMVHYRALFADLLETPDATPPEPASARRADQATRGEPIASEAKRASEAEQAAAPESEREPARRS